MVMCGRERAGDADFATREPSTVLSATAQSAAEQHQQQQMHMCPDSLSHLLLSLANMFGIRLMLVVVGTELRRQKFVP